MRPRFSCLLWQPSNRAATCLLAACIGLWAGCSVIPGPLKQTDRDPLTPFEQLAHREVSSDRLYQAVVEQADAVGYRHQLELQSDLASPLDPADVERITRSFERSLKVMLFDLAPAGFWEQHLADYHAGTLPIEEARTLVDDYDRQVAHASSRVQVLRRSFVTDRLPELLPAIRARSHTFHIQNKAMVPTFLPGDYVIVFRAAYQTAAPRRGDIVLYRYPDEEGKHFFHRVIGISGDRIEVRTQVVSVNGETLAEPYVQHTDPPLVPGNVRDHLGPMTIPPDAYFLLGDNREESVDSRFLGSISKSQILGQLVFIYWSVDPETQSPRWERLDQLVQ